VTATTAPSRLPSTRLLLGADEVHVFWVDLDPPPPTRAGADLLSSDERTRAAGFVFARDQRRYAVSHAALRTILARYLGADAPSLRITQRPPEKPRLVGSSDLRFNLSHSGERAVIAVARGREVGVDIEELRTLDDPEGLAASCFSAKELASWRALPRAARTSSFFATWTRKEAYLKARGDGLARPLGSFDVSVGADDPPRLLRDAEDATAAAGWTFFDLDAGPGYAATLVAAAPPLRVLCWDFIAEEEQGSRRARGGRTGAARPLLTAGGGCS
jgi:4'-phosphopantetheinyl transferase